jgi:hypothetical protein
LAALQLSRTRGAKGFDSIFIIINNGNTVEFALCDNLWKCRSAGVLDSLEP